MFLFDLDGTLYPYEGKYKLLIESHWRAIENVLERRFNIDLRGDFPKIARSLRIDDKTDRYQITKILELFGIWFEEKILEEIGEEYCGIAENLYLQSPMNKLINSIKERTENLIIITASLKKIAIRKLEILGLKQYFNIKYSVFGDKFYTKQQQLEYLLGFLKGIRRVVYFEDSKKILKRNIEILEHYNIDYVAFLVKNKRKLKIKEFIKF